MHWLIKKKSLWLWLLISICHNRIFCSSNDCQLPTYSTGAAEDIPASILSSKDIYGDSPLGVPLRENMVEYLRKDFRKLHKLQRHMAAPDDPKWKQQHGKNVTIVFLGGALCSGAVGKDLDQHPVRKSPSSVVAKADQCESITSDSLPTSCRIGTRTSKSCKPCAYPVRFQTWLQNAYPHLNIRAYNLGAAGMNSQTCLASLDSLLTQVTRPIDMVVLDFSEADKAAGVSGGADAEKLISASFERLVRYFGYTHRAVVIDLEHSTHVSVSATQPVNSAHNQHVTTAHDPSFIVPAPYREQRYRQHDAVINQYELPTLRYEEHAFFNTTLLGQEISYAHHQLLANHLAFFWYKESIKVCLNMRDHKVHSYTHVSTMAGAHDTAHPHHEHHFDHHRLPIMADHKGIQDKIVGPVDGFL